MIESPVVNLEEQPLQWIRNHIHANYGIYFPEEKLYSLESKLKRRYRQLGLDSLEHYARYLARDSDEVPYFLDAVTTNKTYFFREEHQWDVFGNRLKSDWGNRETPLRIWSAACSSGEEPYTAAMVLDRHFNGPQHRVLATDVSEKIIRVGARGIYPETSLDPVREYNPTYARDYFEDYQGETLTVCDRLRRTVYFRQFNLKFHTNPFERAFDVIFLRNVLIYFDREMIRTVINHCEELLRSNGLLLIGQTENLQGIDHGLRKLQPSIFRNEDAT